ncbi:hypothetical protein [uncultured Polaribacter sp.]|uniref:pentapeptide repeat-containing protein n=1 Tax=uncultured Polaribacter sp. TaxID=174711 RepID=UPI0026344198|nr:hypothetical protein [uncultured Polaribacter sp.]
MAVLRKYSKNENYKKEGKSAPLTSVSIHQFLDELEAGEEINYKDYVFSFLVDLSDYVFNKKVRFHNCTFEKGIKCRNTTFNQLVDFYQSTFEDNQYFHLTDFLNISIFSETTFKKAVIFRHNKVSKDTYISFEKAIFKNGLDISNSNFWCTLQVFGIKINNSIPDKESLSYYLKKNLSRSNSEIKICEKLVEELYTIPLNKFNPNNKLINKILLQFNDENHSKVDFNEKIKNSLKSTYKGIRESYRRIKQEFRKNENHIEALDFHHHEMSVFRKELEYKTVSSYEKFSVFGKFKNRIIIIFNKNKIILFLNKISNDYNRSWVRGVIFTLSITFTFFFIVSLILLYNKDISIAMSTNAFKESTNEFIKFINPIAWNHKLYNSDNLFAIIITYVAKIFIGYGYYQTIQAFRKYGKN